MPNNFHGNIVIIDKSRIPNIGTHSCTSLQRKPRSIGSIVAGFTSIAAKRINEIRNTPSVPVWQERFYNRVIRNDKELEKLGNIFRIILSNGHLKKKTQIVAAVVMDL